MKDKKDDLLVPDRKAAQIIASWLLCTGLGGLVHENGTAMRILKSLIADALRSAMGMGRPEPEKIPPLFAIYTREGFQTKMRAFSADEVHARVREFYTGFYDAFPIPDGISAQDRRALIEASPEDLTFYTVQALTGFVDGALFEADGDVDDAIFNNPELQDIPMELRQRLVDTVKKNRWHYSGCKRGQR